MTDNPLHDHGLRTVLQAQLRDLDKEVSTAEQHLADCDQQLAEAQGKQATAAEILADYTNKRDALFKLLDDSNVTRYAVILGADRNGDRVQVVEAAAFDTEDEALAYADSAMGKTIAVLRDEQRGFACGVCAMSISQEGDGSWSHNVDNDDVGHEAVRGTAVADRRGQPDEFLIESDCNVIKDVVAGWTVEAFTLDDGTVNQWSNPVVTDA